MSQLPLAGVRVLDLTRVLAGPLATMRLGDLGADVLKIERPTMGDESRAWGPPFDDRGESAYFLCCNRNKLSVAADLSQPADRDMVSHLLAGADVVVDNFLPGTLAKWGLDPAPLLAAHPRLIWCTITGFGPESARPGYDYVVQAEAGWMSVTGAPDGEPMRAGMALADVLTGKDALIAITAAALTHGQPWLQSTVPAPKTNNSPNVQAAIMAGLMMARIRRRSITLKVSDCGDPTGAST